VYTQAAALEHPCFMTRVHTLRRVGSFGQIMSCILEVWLHALWLLLEWLQPASSIELAPDWPVQLRSEVR
jgi:hypothetical protein